MLNIVLTNKLPKCKNVYSYPQESSRFFFQTGALTVPGIVFLFLLVNSSRENSILKMCLCKIVPMLTRKHLSFLKVLLANLTIKQIKSHINLFMG